MKKILLTIIVFIGIGINVFAQEKSDKELQGDKYYFIYSFDKAIDSYTQAKTLSIEGQRSLAESYYNLDQNIQSEEVYLKLVNESEGVIPEDYYNYAMVLKANGKYDEADKWMDKFKELKPDDLRAKDYAANKNELSNLKTANSKYKIEHLNVNSEEMDFGTSYFEDKIVFASTRNSKKCAKKYNWTGKPFWNMYISEVDGDQLKDPALFDKKFKNRMHDGPASFSNNGTLMAFTRNNKKDKSKDNVVELQIYFCNYNDGKWSKPEPFVLNDKGYSVGHPCLTSDGNTMYFTSDMPGGYGGADLYRIVKTGPGEWGTPQNLGDKINTEGDEMFPFLEENNNILFFSSNGHFGLGGLDIFSSAINANEYGSVYNAGSPLNTQHNDYAFIVDNTMSKGYFSSDRTGGSGGDDIYSMVSTDLDVRFTVYSPGNIPAKRRVREYFPVRNYVFFDLGSTEIPGRYVLLAKDQVKEFKEDQLEVFTPKDLSGRSKRQLTVYYNVLNILGDRLGKNPETVVRLSGASMEGEEDGMAMAESVKKYLVDVFAIDPSRITTEGRIKPRIPSEQPGGILELDLLREGDHRVSIWSESPSIMMEFQSGPDAPLKPVEIITVQEAPLDSYVSFNVEGATEVLSSWTLEIADENGKVQYFGPFTNEDANIPGKSILGERPEGDYNAVMVGKSKSGKIIVKESPVHIVLWTPPENEEGMRFSIIFEFNDSEAIKIYSKYLTDIVTPKIHENGTVIIHGHTDIIGEEAHNHELSVARANEVRGIIEDALAKAGRTDVKFEVYGFGEDTVLAPFDNNFAEERFYNRTVIIDLIPPKK
jgi:outer membrane protein OmpA-like peptidoglycan-associated protein